MHTGRIKVISPPIGDPPIIIREAWVGLTLPCSCHYGPEIEYGTTVADVKIGDFFFVPQTEAFKILKGSNPKAAQWWFDQGFPTEDKRYLGFNLASCEILDDSVHDGQHCEAMDSVETHHDR